MLMITVMAFATDYKGQLDYTVTTRTGDLTGPSNAQGVLKIEDYAGGKYTVTATGCDLSSLEMGNWDEIICEGVEATTDANGVTTIDVTPYAFRSSDNAQLKDAKLFVKFKGDKAYATFEGTYNPNFYTNYKLKYTFGVDEGFDGGSTGGGEDKPAAFEKVNFVGDGTNFDWKIPVNWDTQKIVMSIDPSTCTGACEDIIGLGEVATAWDNTLHLYRKPDGTLQGYFNVPGGSNNNTNPFDETNPIKVEVSKAKGFVVNDVVKIPASEMSALFALSTVNMGTGEGANDKSRATYNYVKVVDKDWTEVPPVTVVDTKEFKNVAYTTSMGGNGTATVTFTEMSDGTCPMTFVSDDLNVKAENLTKGTDEKGRTTYTGTAKRTDVDVTFTVKAVVYGEATAQKLYMTMDNGSGFVVTVGEDPDYVAPEAPKDVTVVEKYQADGSGFSHTINVDWDKQKIVASIDFSNGGDDKDILAMTTGDSFTAFQTSTYRTMHWYCNQTAKQISGFFAKDGAGNNNTGRMDVADCLAKFEISKAEGLKVNGEVKMTPTVLEELLTGDRIIIGSGESPKFSKAYYNYIKVVSLDWKETTEPEVTVKDEKTFNEALYMQDQKVADATVVVKEMSDETINMSLKFGENEYTSTELTKGTDEKNRTTYTGKVANGTQTYDVAGVVYEKDNVARLYMTLKTSITTVVVGENPDVVTPEVTEVSNKTYTSNLRILDGETTVVEEAEANVNIVKYSDESYKVTLKNVNMLNKTQDLVFVGKALIEEAPTEATEPLTIIAKSDEATTTFFGEEMNGTFEITEVSAEEIKMGFVLNNTSLEYQGEFNYTEEETPEVYTSNLHIYDAAAPETDLFQADQAKVEFLATATGEFKLTLKDVTLNEKTQDLVFTGTLPTPQPGGQDPLAEEGETTPAEPAMVLNAIADEATATFLGATSATAVFNVIMNDEAETENDAFALTFAITAGEKTLGGEFNYEKTPDVEEYPINFDKTANSTHNSRALNSFSLQQTGKEKQTKSVKTSKAAYEDHTADEPFTVEAGSELTASFDYTGEWMHSFVYIDFDNDGQFSYKEGQWDQTGTDLVAFSFYSLDSNPKNDASGYNSVGDELTGDARNTYVAPSFKAPAKAGEYRIRFKFDWNCILPGGSSSILSDGGGVWDATLKVVEPVVDGISTINAEVANGEAQLFTVNGVKLNKLQKGLNIVRTADGKVKKVLVK